MKAKKKWPYLAIGLTAAVLIVVIGLIVYYLFIMKKTLQQITTPEKPQEVFSVYVLDEDSAVTLQDTRGYPYGISKGDQNLTSMEMTFVELEKALEEKPSVTAYENTFALVDGLRRQSSRAIVLNEAYRQSIAEAEGYEWTLSGIRKIESFVLKGQETEKDEIVVPDNIPEFFVAYISGIDTFGGIAARSRSDVNILLAVNLQSREIFMLATPRDYYVDFSVTGGAKDKLTHAGIYGVETSIDALERLYGVNVDYYLRLNFAGFVDIIDALGGIEVYSEYDFTVENIKDYHKGYNRLNGLEALAFARERYSFPNGDYQRAKNQMEVIKAVITKCASPAILKNYSGVMSAIAGSVETNMPEEQITTLVKMQLKDNRKWTFSSFTVGGVSSYQPAFSIPGRNLYVIIPDQDSVNQAKEKIEKIRKSK